jgi:hypothetical protein
MFSLSGKRKRENTVGKPISIEGIEDEQITNIPLAK